MKLKSIFAIVALSVAGAFAGQHKDTKVDSIIYETGAEWRIFSTDGPVKSFSFQKDLLWYVTEKGVGYTILAAVKKRDEQVFADISGVPAADVNCCAVDASGVAWVGTKAGLAMRTKDGFKLITKENGLADNEVNKILCAKPGVMWVGTANGASVLQGGTWKSYTSKDGLAGDVVHDMTVGMDGTIWFGTNKGISCFDGTKWTNHTMKTGLSWNDTRAITFDPRKNTIWAAVGEKDMNSYDGKAWKVFMDVGEGIVSIMADSQSRIWIATGAGLMKFNGDEWVTDPGKLGITAASVSQMIRDEKGNLWYGMEKGVLKLNNPYPY